MAPLFGAAIGGALHLGLFAKSEDDAGKAVHAGKEVLPHTETKAG